MAGAATQKALLTINTGRSAMFRPLQRRLARGRVPAMLAAALACAAAVPASATVMTALHLNVYRDGSSADWLLGNSRLLADGFDNGNPYAGPNYSGSADTAAYTLQGLAPGANAALAAREQGGALLLDPGYGASSANALGQTGYSLRLRLQTNIVDADHGLPQSRSFAATPASPSASASPTASATAATMLSCMSLTAAPVTSSSSASRTSSPAPSRRWAVRRWAPPPWAPACWCCR